MRINDSLQSVSWSSDPTLASSVAANPKPGFAQTMDQVQQELSLAASLQTRTVNQNENLTLLVRQEAHGRGLQLNATQQKSAIATLARDNQLDNPDRVRVGQKLRMDGLVEQLDQFKNQAQSTTSNDDARALQAANASTEISANSNASSNLSLSDSHRTVRSRDTLTQIVSQEARSRGLSLSQAQVYKEVMDLAQTNRLKNPNQIWTGQQIDVAQLQNHLDQLQNTPRANQSEDSDLHHPIASVKSPPQLEARQIAPSSYPVLNQTLDRAVARGFIPANERQDVYNKILQVAQKHQFSPDDFARLTLMESDGMNPRASNQRCHGIIQFCDGPAQGAAGVGYGQAPKSILNLSVYQQLHLVDVYFDKVGLKKQGPVKLDDLYLAVLHPAARSETRPEAPLDIAGTQALALYEGRNTQTPITRNSIIQGLWKNAMDRLGLVDKTWSPKVGSRPLNTSSGLPDDHLISSSSEKL